MSEFSIYDMLSRSEENAHGAKIEDWIVRYSEPVESNGTNTSQAASPGKNENRRRNPMKNRQKDDGKQLQNHCSA